MSLPAYLGVDGGGTSTVAWLADLEGRVVGRGASGASNAKAVGPGPARAALDGAIASAFADAGANPGPLRATCLGLAGFDRPEDKDQLTAWMDAQGRGGRLVLVNDGDLVVAAGTPEGWGAGVIAGTGSIAVGRSADGRTTRAGGWGYLFGDEGSGYAVAVAGLRRLARRHDGRSPAPSGPDPLAEAVCKALDIGGVRDLVSVIYGRGFDRTFFAGLAPAVVAASADDPSIAAEILEPAGVELARMVAAVARNLGWEVGPLPLAMAGGFLLSTPIVSRAMLAQLAVDGYDVRAEPVAEPVRGALILARRAVAP